MSKLGESSSKGGDRNPFRLPSDEEIFMMRDEERKRRNEERRQQLSLSVQEKSTWNSRLSTSTLKFNDPKSSVAKVLRMETTSKPGSSGGGGGSSSSGSGGFGGTSTSGNFESAAAQAAADQDDMPRSRDKEKLSDFIAKKREMFLIQMALDTKRQEIRKLDEKAQEREKKLRDDERLLEENASKFDEFLKDNDMKAVEAMKKAEAETKAKQEKVQEIKKLNSQILAMKSEISKYDEQLEECRKYKAFLDMLAPPEYTREQIDLKRKRRDERRAKARAEGLSVPASARPASDRDSARSGGHPGPTASHPPSTAASVSSSTGGGGGGARRSQPQHGAARRDLGTADSAAGGRRPHTSGTTDDGGDGTDFDHRAGGADGGGGVEDDEDLSDTEVPMFFQRPGQLLDIFTQLEESNLFLIQNCQETEESLDALKQEFAETKLKMDRDTQNLQAQMETLQQSIALEEQKAQALSQRAQKNTGVEEQEHQLDELSEKVSDVYVQCGFDNDANISTIQMLTNIEARLEEMLTVIGQMPREYVEAAEKSKEKERRQRLRQEKLDIRKREMEERIQRAVERSKAPIKKKTGKPVMFRSVPVERKQSNDDDDKLKKQEEEDDYREFFTE